MVLRLQKDGRTADVRRQPQEFIKLGSRRRGIARCAVLLACLTATACGSSDKEEEVKRSCPPVRLVQAADNLTIFRRGPGRDITDIDFQAKLINFRGECDFDDGKAELEFVIDFVVEKGPANKSGAAKFSYFVAIPRFYPNPAGKKIFPVTVKFEGAVARMRYRDEIEVDIPLTAKQSPSDFPVYVGIQLTPAQLEYNRSSRRRR